MGVYSNFFMDEDEEEKKEKNMETYERLRSKYNIMVCADADKGSVSLDHYDIVISHIGSMYSVSYYRLIKNAPRLQDDEIALICDRGDVQFGYVAIDSLMNVNIGHSSNTHSGQCIFAINTD